MLKRKWLLLLLAPLALLLIGWGAFAYDPIPTDAMNPKPAIIAHRGASGSAPENTLSAFKKAMEIVKPQQWIQDDIVKSIFRQLSETPTYLSYINTLIPSLALVIVGLLAIKHFSHIKAHSAGAPL